MIKNRDTRWFLLIALMMCFFPWNERASSIGLIALALHTFIDADWRTKWREFTWTPLSTLALCFWLWHVVGLAWTNNPAAAAQSIQVKAAMLILPILLGLENHWNERRRYYITLAFVGSLLMAFVYLLVVAQLKAGHLPLSVRWQRMMFAEPLMNPGYISNYYAVGILLLATEKKCWQSMQRAVCSSLAIAMLMWAVLIFIAKLSILFILLLTGVLILQGLHRKIKNRWVFGGVTTVALLVLVYSVSILPPVKRRLEETDRQLAVEKPADINLTNSTMSRKVTYKLETKLLQEAGWFGFGTGTTNQKVLEALDAGGYVQLVSADMHAHNQFMNAGISLGWIGLMLLLLFTATALVMMYQKSGLFDMGIGVLMFMNLAIEDLFEIQAGIVFFLLWVFLFCTRRRNVAP